MEDISILKFKTDLIICLQNSKFEETISTIKIKRKVKVTLLKIRESEKFKGKIVELEIKVKELSSEKNN